MEFELKNSDDFLKIEDLEVIYPEGDTWDRNMLDGQIIINAGKFKGDFHAVIATYDFERLKQGLLGLYNYLKGEFDFKTVEGHLSIKIKGDGIGHFNCDCIANDNPGIYGTELRFSSYFDQTQINDLVNQLDSIMKAYPIIWDKDASSK